MKTIPLEKITPVSRPFVEITCFFICFSGDQRFPDFAGEIAKK